MIEKNRISETSLKRLILKEFSNVSKGKIDEIINNNELN